jgi:hypothetical protein
MTAIDQPQRDNGHAPLRFLRRKPPAGAPATEGERVEVPFLDCGPEVVMALGTGRTTFQDVVLAYFFGREPTKGEQAQLGVSPDDRAQLRSNFNVLVRNFETEHGRIRRSYFARHCLAAAVLTDRDEIEVVLARDVPCSELIQIIRRAQALGYLAWHRLERYDRSLCQRMIFSVILEVLRRLDQSHRAEKPGERLSAADLAHLRRNLDEAEDFMLRCATRRAQTEYLQGMLTRGTLLLLPLLLAAAATVAENGGSFESLLGQAVLVAIAGAVGAMVSVMWRMTSGTFSINLPTLGYGSAISTRVVRRLGAGSRWSAGGAC